MNQTLIERTKTAFRKKFDQNPILVFAPGRINLIGEHTDYNQGFVFPAAIDKGIVAAVSKTNDDECIAVALDIEDSFSFQLNNLQPIVNGDWKNYVVGVVAEIQKKGKTIENFNLVFSGDIPNGAGLSSSAALENSVVFALNELFDLGFSKEEMIFISQKAEHNYVGVKCGIMDQYASMFGQENTALMLDCKSLEAIEHTIDFKDYTILLINSNVSHNLADSAYNERRTVCERVSRALKKQSLRDVSITELEAKKTLFTNNDYLKALYVLEENKRVHDASNAIKNNDLEFLGQLLFKSHEGLSKQYEVSCDELDFLVEEAQKNAQILGARMMGGGFGGCTINLIKKDAISHFTDRISKAYQTTFNKACSFYQVNLSKGTHLIA